MDYDPKKLISESFKIDGISDEECRSIFFGWVLDFDLRIDMRFMIINITLFLLILLLSFEISYAHVSERALTLLLPTEIYIPSGIAVLVLTILITYISPKAFIGKLFRTY